MSYGGQVGLRRTGRRCASRNGEHLHGRMCVRESKLAAKPPPNYVTDFDRK
jgi:hypothetical protein